MKNTDANKELKQLVGKAAAAEVQDGMICGLGTGSTVVFMVEELGRRVNEENLKIVGVPTSFQTKLLCSQLNIPTMEIQDCSYLDLAIDGADEVDPELNLIKGGGAAHTREKIVVAMAKKFIVIVDETKLVQRLGEKFAVPVEIIPSALKFITQTLIQLGGEPQLRMGVRKDGPVITDNGQMLLDVRFPATVNLKEIDQILHNTPGVIETGLFFNMAQEALVGTAATKEVKRLLKN